MISESPDTLNGLGHVSYYHYSFCENVGEGYPIENKSQEKTLVHVYGVGVYRQIMLYGLDVQLLYKNIQQRSTGQGM